MDLKNVVNISIKVKWFRRLLNGSPVMVNFMVPKEQKTITIHCTIRCQSVSLSDTPLTQ